MSHHPRLILGGLIVFVAVTPSSAQSKKLETVMRDKFENTQQLLEPLLTGNYRLIERYAERLSHINYTEIGSWQSNATPDYLKEATAFVRAVQGLREAAADRRLDRATAEYGALVSSCTRCHANVRALRVVSLRRQGTSARGNRWP